jgi:hypothetical protein
MMVPGMEISPYLFREVCLHGAELIDRKDMHHAAMSELVQRLLGSRLG